MKNSKNILIIDDDIQISSVLKAVIEKHTPHQVTQVNGAQDALNILATKQFQIILLDFQMPNINGYETLKLIQKQRLHPNPPIVISSTYSVDFLKDKFKGEKIHAFFDKGKIFESQDQEKFLSLINE